MNYDLGTDYCNLINSIFYEDSAEIAEKYIKDEINRIVKSINKIDFNSDELLNIVLKIYFCLGIGYNFEIDVDFLIKILNCTDNLIKSYGFNILSLYITSYPAVTNLFYKILFENIVESENPAYIKQSLEILSLSTNEETVFIFLPILVEIIMLKGNEICDYSIFISLLLTITKYFSYIKHNIIDKRLQNYKSLYDIFKYSGEIRFFFDLYLQEIQCGKYEETSDSYCCDKQREFISTIQYFLKHDNKSLMTTTVKCLTVLIDFLTYTDRMEVYNNIADYTRNWIYNQNTELNILEDTSLCFLIQSFIIFLGKITYVDENINRRILDLESRHFGSSMFQVIFHESIKHAFSSTIKKEIGEIYIKACINYIKNFIKHENYLLYVDTSLKLLEIISNKFKYFFDFISNFAEVLITYFSYENKIASQEIKILRILALSLSDTKYLIRIYCKILPKVSYKEFLLEYFAEHLFVKENYIKNSYDTFLSKFQFNDEFRFWEKLNYFLLVSKDENSKIIFNYFVAFIQSISPFFNSIFKIDFSNFSSDKLIKDIDYFKNITKNINSQIKSLFIQSKVITEYLDRKLSDETIDFIKNNIGNPSTKLSSLCTLLKTLNESNISSEWMNNVYKASNTEKIMIKTIKKTFADDMSGYIIISKSFSLYAKMKIQKPVIIVDYELYNSSDNEISNVTLEYTGNEKSIEVEHDHSHVVIQPKTKLNFQDTFVVHSFFRDHFDLCVKFGNEVVNTKLPIPYSHWIAFTHISIDQFIDLWERWLCPDDKALCFLKNTTLESFNNIIHQCFNINAFSWSPEGFLAYGGKFFITDVIYISFLIRFRSDNGELDIRSDSNDAAHTILTHLKTLLKVNICN